MKKGRPCTGQVSAGRRQAGQPLALGDSSHRYAGTLGRLQKESKLESLKTIV